MTAVVTRLKGPKLLVLSENDKEMSISSGRVIHRNHQKLDPTLPRLELVRFLKEISIRRAALAESLDLNEIWELLEGEGEEFGYDFLAELVWPGPAAGDQVAAMLRAVFADGLFFKMKPESALRHSLEKVEEMTLARRKEEERRRRLETGGDWLARVWAGETPEDPPHRDRLVEILKDAAVFENSAPEYKFCQKLLNRAGLPGSPQSAFQVLLRLGEVGLHENLDLIREGVASEFSPDALAEAERLAACMTWRDEDRRDLTDLLTITVDSGGARDFDDAVSLDIRPDGNILLGVHIADVSAVVKPGTPLDLEAMERSTSIYMPDQRIPMLPEILSEECLSLRENEVRPAFSLLAQMTPEGDVLDYEFTPSLVKVKRQLTYQEVDSSVQQDLTLKRMYKISLSLKANRDQAGAMLLSLPKLNVFLTPEGEIGVNLTMWENPGRSMISEFMILANHLAARKLAELEHPCYYRVQAAPSQRLIQSEADAEDLFLSLRQRRFLSPVSWSLERQPHVGMGLDAYTNLTSPLRRYIDLIIQRQVGSLLHGAPMYDHDEMGRILAQVDEARRRAMRVQNRRRRYWLLRWMENQPREKCYEALVLEKVPRRWRIFLTELMTDVDLPLQGTPKLDPGDTIMVRIRKIDPREDILKFELR